MDTSSIRTYFGKLGLETEIADMYLSLHVHGPQTISQLSRTAKVERTRIYRLIDKLMASNLIEVETHYKRGIIKAAPIANLHILISQKEQELRSLQDELGLIEQVLARNSLSSPASRVQFYHGIEGVKQMYWNQTKAKSCIDCILFENMQHKTKLSFFERWVRRCNERDLTFRGIVCNAFIEGQKRWYAKNSNERLMHWEQRYVPDTVFQIQHSTVIYDNVASYYNWKDGEIFGIEIYSEDIARQQQQFFELLWDQATPDNRGRE